jgi:hypothetical protein
LGIGDWGLGPIPNPQSPIPNPQSPIPNEKNIMLKNKYYYKNNYYFKTKIQNKNYLLCYFYVSVIIQ